MLGQIIKGRYRIVQILGSGGYCQTYLAQDISQQQPKECVIKHLISASGYTSNSLSNLRRLFTREAAALEKLGTYPQVPQLLDHFEEDQQFYLVQEYIAGQDLSKILKPGVRWTQSEVIELLHEVLSILEVVHAQGLIHRDIKPSNLIRRGKDGRIVLIDFGSVKQAWTQVVTAQGQTNANYALGVPATVAIGTPGYMPSEQSRGRPRPNSDIYALGMVAIQALTGFQPTMLLEDADSGEVIWQHHCQVSPELGAILNQMVRYHFNERYQTASQVLTALQPLVAQYVPQYATVTSVASTPVKQPKTAAKTNSTSKTSSRRNNVALWLGMIIGVISALGLMIGSYYMLRRPAPKVSPPVQKSLSAIATPNVEYAKVAVAHTLKGHSDTVWAVAVSRDGRTLVSGSADKTIKVWNLKTGQLRQTLSGHSDIVRSVTIGPDGQTLASGSGDRTLKIWNLQTGKLLGTLNGHVGPVWSVAISRDGRTVVSGEEDGSIKFWSLQTGELHRTIPAHLGRVFSVALSPDGQICATAGMDKTIKIWQMETGNLLRTLEGHSDTVRSVNFSPNGQKLASSSWDRTIKIWNVQTGEQLNTLKGHQDRVIDVVFSGDGKTLISGSNDKTIKIWDVQTGKLLRTLIGHTDWVLAVTTSPVEQILVSSSKDKTLKIWQ